MLKKWTEDEEFFMIENYPKYGVKFCSDKLKRSSNAVRTRAKKLGLKWGRVKMIYHKDYLEKVVKLSKNISMVLDNLKLRKAGGNYRVINKYIKEYNLDITHFEKGEFKLGSIPKNKINLQDILVENSTYCRYNLKKRLYDQGLLKRECCLCGQDENWNGMKISLILDHINGVFNDNRLENLRVVCPNCNAGLDTFAGKNKKNRCVRKFRKVKDVDYGAITNKCECGNSKLKISKSCESCFHIRSRKVERPNIEDLNKEVEEFGYSATGRKYGVSDNAIRKWLKSAII